MAQIATPLQSELRTEAGRRRTFAIISHPDAGKTTLTEKLLLYSGMIRTAGMVRGRKGGKVAASDWMEMEQERGISITASAMQFYYKRAVINVLDTPGHQDFSGVRWIVQYEISFGFSIAIVSPVAEKIFAKSFARCCFQKACRNDLVGIDIFNRQGNCLTF